MKHASPWVLISVPTCVLLGLLAVVFIVSRGAGMPDYQALGRQAGYEIRSYDGYLEARVSIVGSRSFAVLEGTRVLTGYLRGDNTLQEAVAPSRPDGVESGPLSERIGYWAPVAVYERSGSFDISVILPQTYTIVTLPRPNNPSIRILQITPAVVAVHGWRGASDDTRVNAEEEKLRGLLSGQKRAILSAVRTVHYGPGWIPSFARLNEVQISVGIKE